MWLSGVGILMLSIPREHRRTTGGVRRLVVTVSYAAAVGKRFRLSLRLRFVKAATRTGIPTKSGSGLFVTEFCLVIVANAADLYTCTDIDESKECLLTESPPSNHIMIDKFRYWYSPRTWIKVNNDLDCTPEVRQNMLESLAGTKVP